MVDNVCASFGVSNCLYGRYEQKEKIVASSYEWTRNLRRLAYIGSSCKAAEEIGFDELYMLGLISFLDSWSVDNRRVKQRV